MASRKEAKAAYPIFMGVIQGFDDLETEKNQSKYLKKSKNLSKYLKKIYPFEEGVLGVELGDALEGTDVIVGGQEAV